MTIKTLLLTCPFIFSGFVIMAADFRVQSPNGKITVKVNIEKGIRYAVEFRGAQVVEPSLVSFQFAQAPPLGNDLKVIADKTASVDESWKPVLKKFESVRNQYNNLILELQEIRFPQRFINLEFRVFKMV